MLTLFHPGYPKSHIDLFNLALLGLQLVLFFTLSRTASQVFFLLYFAFWRAAYDFGLGWVLTKQSKRKWIVREVQRLGWLDEKRKPEMRQWIKHQLAGKMGKDYSFDVRYLSLSPSHDQHSSYPRAINRNCRWNTTHGSSSVSSLTSSCSSAYSDSCRCVGLN